MNCNKLKNNDNPFFSVNCSRIIFTLATSLPSAQPCCSTTYIQTDVIDAIRHFSPSTSRLLSFDDFLPLAQLQMRPHWQERGRASWNEGVSLRPRGVLRRQGSREGGEVWHTSMKRYECMMGYSKTGGCSKGLGAFRFFFK